MRAVSTGGLALGLGAVLFLSAGEAAALGQRRNCEAPPTYKVVLEVCHPRTCCKIDVPVCIPCYCQGAPCVRFEHTLLGPGKTVFTWSCGHQVTVRYTGCGGVRVVQRH